jgi:uncharacterized cupin superfamily protein
MPLKKPALDPMTLTARTSSGYPEPYRSRVLPREKRALGDALGLKTIGINHTVLAPGKESSMRHWHTHEEEFVYVLSGEVVLRTDGGEQVLTPGMCAGFPASADGKTGDGHQLINRGVVPAVYLEVSNRDARDQAFYTEVDLHFHGADAAVQFTRKDGSRF